MCDKYVGARGPAQIIIIQLGETGVHCVSTSWKASRRYMHDE